MLHEKSGAPLRERPIFRAAFAGGEGPRQTGARWPPCRQTVKRGGLLFCGSNVFRRPETGNSTLISLFEQENHLFSLYYIRRKQMYFKRWSPAHTLWKSTALHWVQWIHHSEGKTHCSECLMLDGCFFQQGKAPPCPHHPYCHCTLEEVGDTVVWANVFAYSDYSKFDPYLFNTQGKYPHTKEKLFALWGYTVEDAPWLQTEMERQAKEKYLRGDYTLGKLNKDGQRICIRIEIPRKSGNGTVSFISGWMAEPNGKLRLTTPYGGK